MVKISNGESGFLGHVSINGEMVKWWNDKEIIYCNDLYSDISLLLGLPDWL